MEHSDSKKIYNSACDNSLASTTSGAGSQRRENREYSSVHCVAFRKAENVKRFRLFPSVDANVKNPCHPQKERTIILLLQKSARLPRTALLKVFWYSQQF